MSDPVQNGINTYFHTTQQAVNLLAQRADTTTGATSTVSYEHHEIHGGSHYYLSGFEAEDTDGTIEFIFVTPDTTKWAHMTFTAASTGAMTIEVYEGATTVAGGTPITPINNNRNSANTSGLGVLKDPASIGGDGVLIDAYSVGATGVGMTVGAIGTSTRDKELILAQDETYLFRITSNGDANVISFKASWYEHTNKT